MDSSQTDTVSHTTGVCNPRSTSTAVSDDRKENNYHRNQEEKVKIQHSDPAGLYFDDCGTLWQLML